LFRVFVATGIMDTRSMEALYSFVVHHIQFPRSKSPSSGYMRNLNVDDGDVLPVIVKKVRATLVELIAYIDKHFKAQLRY
jgi:hypothetical protein